MVCAPGYTKEPSGCCAKVGIGGSVLRSCPGILTPQQVAAVTSAPGAVQPVTPTCPNGQILDPATQICVPAPVQDATAQDIVATPASAPAGTKYDVAGPMIQSEAPTMDPTLAAAIHNSDGTSNSLIGAIVGGATGFLTGGPGGAVVGALSGALGSGGGSTGGQGSSIPDANTFAGGCPPGSYQVGNTCVNPGAALPGGSPFTFPTGGTQVGSPGGTAVVPAGGGGGMMGAAVAVAPFTYSQLRRQCPPGYVLGKDNLCYAKGMIPKKYRKWTYNKPYITRGDYKAIARADRTRKKLVGLTKKSGAFASMSKPKPRGGSRGVITKSEAARALRR